MNTKKQERQERTSKRLDAQLSSGVKPEVQKDFAGVKKIVNVPLSEQDITRIKKERAVLKARTGK